MHEQGAPGLIVRPDKRCLNSSPRLPGPLQKIKGHIHDRALHLFIPGFAARVSQGKVCEKKARNAAFFYNIPGRPDNHRGDIIFFEMPGYQTHGLMADRSESWKNQGIHAILPAKLKDLRRRFLAGFTLAVIGHSPVESR